jgi:hypothetical protein
MEPREDQPQHDSRRRVDALLVWTATTGAIVCAAFVWLATNVPQVDPVAEPVPTTDWSLPAATSSVTSAETPGPTFEALAPTNTVPTVLPSPSAATAGPAPTTGRSSHQPAPTATPTSRPSSTRLKALGAGKCLELPGSTAAPGTRLQISDCTGQAGQAWTRTASGELTVTLGGTLRCADAYGQGVKPGTPVVSWPCNGQDNQRWKINPNGTVTGVQSGLCLDVTDGSTADGALVELWTCNGRKNQQWTLG